LDISVDDKTGDPHVSRTGQFINVNHFDNPITFMRMRMGVGQPINVNHFDNPINFMRMLYLVESCGELLLVRRMILHEHARGSGEINTFDGQCESELAHGIQGWLLRTKVQWAKVTSAPFVWLISHRPAVLFSQNKSATSNQPTVLFSRTKPAPAVSHQQNEQAVALRMIRRCF
jgi:hypothetical protein